ncbi:hypothetical protein BDV95DRAFT_568933 [Massariosphaeria phaeospora]|uniref:Uncharacterized protein n=1 Tax=Massariosphaeria phaeospora TaxID=100035 RepID=A0A7C8IA51_9PLEO|nr:hypothetical protein BDV95DRAFT_568933 [Massariosphaeria phaeospora]
MPTLQGLPQELLEIIFLYSMNISLPRASPDLGLKLSSKAVTMEVVMRTFFHTVDHKAPARKQTGTSDVSRQSELLACRFFTWSFFLDYVNKAHDAFINLRGKAWEKTGVAIPDASYFDGLWPFKFTTINFLSFAEGFLIPEKLLHGPWTEEKASLLYVLVSLNGEIDWKGSMAGEIAKEGLRTAIAEKNERAVAALSVLLGIEKAITTDTIRYAVHSGGCDLNIIRHLLFNAQILYKDTPKDVINFLDPALWKWADDRTSSDDHGERLKDMLKKAEKFTLDFYTNGEKDWLKLVPFPYSGAKFDTRSVFDDIVRELLTRLYQNHGRRITSRGGRRAAQGLA